MEDKKEGQNHHIVKNLFGGVFRLVAAIGVIFGVAFAVHEIVDRRIEYAMNNEQFIRKVAMHVRPYAIFDANEVIHHDGGAGQYLYLEKIKVETGTRKGSIIDVKIIVTPKHHLAYPPLIETLGAERFIFTHIPKRGKGHQWLYECEVQQWEEHATKPISFRLEILK